MLVGPGPTVAYPNKNKISTISKIEQLDFIIKPPVNIRFPRRTIKLTGNRPAGADFPWSAWLCDFY